MQTKSGLPQIPLNSSLSLGGRSLSGPYVRGSAAVSKQPQESLGPNQSAGSRRGLTELHPDPAKSPKPREVAPCLPSSINLSKAESGQRRPTSSPLPRQPGLPMLTSFQRGASVCKSQGIMGALSKVKVKSLPFPGVLRTILVVTLGFLTHKLTTPFHPLRTQVNTTGFLLLRRESTPQQENHLPPHSFLKAGEIPSFGTH